MAVLVALHLPAHIGWAVDSLSFGWLRTNTTFDAHHSLRSGPDIVLKTGTRYFQITVYLDFSATGRGDHTRKSFNDILLAKRRTDPTVRYTASFSRSFAARKVPTSPGRPFPQCLSCNTCVAWWYLWAVCAGLDTLNSMTLSFVIEHVL